METMTVSPLHLLLDAQNPRFVILANRSQSEIRKYLVMYEDAVQMARDINDYGGLMPGERIVVLREGEKLVVVEGNRRTCAIQMLLCRELIPNGFEHMIPKIKEETRRNLLEVQVDVLSSRDKALELMARRHILGIKNWQPIARMQFFASAFRDGRGISELSRVTNVPINTVKSYIRDFNFFYHAYKLYLQEDPKFSKSLMELRPSTFIRIFEVRFKLNGESYAPHDVLQIYYDDELNTRSALPDAIFDRVVLSVFEAAYVTKKIDTRSTLVDVPGIIPLLEQALSRLRSDLDDTEGEKDNNQGGKMYGPTNRMDRPGPSRKPGDEDLGRTERAGRENSNEQPQSDVPKPGGPSPAKFFENISWTRLDPSKSEHEGLLVVLHELHSLSTKSIGKRRAYEEFPVATGMVLRTAYEQALVLRLKETDLWGQYLRGLDKKEFPSLGSIEQFCAKNLERLLPDRGLKGAFKAVQASDVRSFLNATVHSPGDIRTSPVVLESMAQGGMRTLIQGIINLVTREEGVR